MPQKARECAAVWVSLTTRTIASALFAILSLLAPSFAQAPDHQQPPAVKTPSPSAAPAQGQSPEVRVAVVVLPPMVMEENGQLDGFTIDLWNAIAARLKLKTNYQILPDGVSLDEAMRSGPPISLPQSSSPPHGMKSSIFRIRSSKMGCRSWCENRGQQQA